jgi:SNF2 family DNA or RNA helicase
LPETKWDEAVYYEEADRAMGALNQGILEGISDSVSTLRRINGLKKVRNIARLVDQELKDNAYEKIIIFGIHREVIGELHSELHHHGVVTVYGMTKPRDRQEAIDAFQFNPGIRVFIGNITAAGTAITLTAANQVLFAEMDWVPGNNAQAMARAHRRGQEKTVFVRFAALDDSLDTKITKVLKRKTEELTQLIDGGNND